MNEIQGIHDFIQNPITWLLAAWLIREVWSIGVQANKSKEEANKSFKTDVTGALKENSDRLATMTVALVKLESKFDSISQLALMVPKLAQDITILFERIKSLTPEQE